MTEKTAFTRALIEEVRKFPALWDNSNPLHKNRLAIANCWLAVSATLHKNPKVCKLRWKSTKDRFVRSMRVVKREGSGDYDIIQVKSYGHLKQLDFLRPTLIPRDTDYTEIGASANTFEAGNGNEEGSDAESDTNDDKQRTRSSATTAATVINLTEDDLTPSPLSPASTSKSITRSESATAPSAPQNKRAKKQFDTVEKAFLQKIQEITSDDNEFFHYGRYIASTLSKLKPANQVIVTHKIDQILFEAKMSELNEATLSEV